MAATIWKGHLTFGLISVPVKLFAAARTETIGFNQIHQPCGQRIKMQTFCPTCNRAVERKELQKGYEIESGRFIIIEEADIEKMVPQSAKTLEVKSFAKMADVDPVYFDKSYYMVPDGPAGEKAYYLLVKALTQSGYAGIASITMHQREHIVVVRPALDGLMLHTLFYTDEVRKVDEYGHPDKVQVADKELELAQMFINALAAPFDPQGFRDQYRDNVMKMIQAKAAGQEIQAPAPVPQAPIMDLMAALKASIEKSGTPPSDAAPAAPAPAATAPAAPPAPAPEPVAVAAAVPVAAPQMATVAAPASVPVAAPQASVPVAPPQAAVPQAAVPVAAPQASVAIPQAVVPQAVPVATPQVSDGGSTVASSSVTVQPAPATVTSAEPATRAARKKPPIRLSPAADSPDSLAQ